MTKIEFFNPNNVNSKCTYTFTTASLENAPFLYDNDIYTTLSSDGSVDGTNEKWTIQFESSKLVDFVLLCNHNFKTFNVKYLDSSLAEQDFTEAISVTGNTTVLSHAFYITQQECYGLVVNCTYTIDASEKSLGELRALDKFGELPRPKKCTPVLNFEEDIKKKYDGGTDRIVNGVKFECTVKFDDLTGGDYDSTDDDISTLIDLYERGRPFYIYLSPLSVKKTKKFYRVCDMYLVNTNGDQKPKAPDELVDDVSWESDLKVKEV